MWILIIIAVSTPSLSVSMATFPTEGHCRLAMEAMRTAWNKRHLYDDQLTMECKYL